MIYKDIQNKVLYIITRKRKSTEKHLSSPHMPILGRLTPTAFNSCHDNAVANHEHQPFCRRHVYSGYKEVMIRVLIQATLLNPDICNPNFRLNRTYWKVPVPSYTKNSYKHNPDFA